MSKIQRNDPCPCGSGLKYKKCCLQKAQAEVDKTLIKSHFMSYDAVSKMSTNAIISQLESIGIHFDETQFFNDIENFNSARQMSNQWCHIYHVSETDQDSGFSWLAAWILWERLAPKHKAPIEHINDEIELGYTYSDQCDSIKACDHWLEAWNAIKYRIKQKHCKIDVVEELYPDDSFPLSVLLENLEMELQNAGIDDPFYFDKCIGYCREICDYFSDEDESFLHNFRRAIADSLFSTNRLEEANEEFDRLIKDYPNNIWSYIAYGDAYCLSINKKAKDPNKARKLYEKALLVAADEEEKGIVRERIDDVND